LRSKGLFQGSLIFSLDTSIYPFISRSNRVFLKYGELFKGIPD